MNTSTKFWTIIAAGIILVHMTAGVSLAGDLVTKSCQELITMAQSYQQDLKTVDTVLGSAIDAGSLERIRSYKLKKGAVTKKLRAVMSALQVRGCLTKD